MQGKTGHPLGCPGLRVSGGCAGAWQEKSAHRQLARPPDGVHINCYAAGDIVSRKTTTDVGGLNGRSGGIAVDDNCYFNSEALQKQGNTVNAPAVAVGGNAIAPKATATRAELAAVLHRFCEMFA